MLVRLNTFIGDLVKGQSVTVASLQVLQGWEEWLTHRTVDVPPDGNTALWGNSCKSWECLA